MGPVIAVCGSNPNAITGRNTSQLLQLHVSSSLRVPCAADVFWRQCRHIGVVLFGFGTTVSNLTTKRLTDNTNKAFRMLFSSYRSPNMNGYTKIQAKEDVRTGLNIYAVNRQLTQICLPEIATPLKRWVWNLVPSLEQRKNTITSLL
jgi:hypothetical protein